MKRFKLRLTAIPLALLGLAASLQAQNYEQEIRKPGSEIDIQSKITNIGEEAQRRKILEGEKDVSYDEVLADPDNLDLNYRYARTQVRQGNLKGASATLERILLIDPNLSKVRLVYAIVLFRLQDMVEAERELNALKGVADLPENLRRETDKYLTAVEKSYKRTVLSGRVSAGVQYDTNRNSASSSGQRLLTDVPITLTGTSLKRADVSKIFIGNLELRRDLARNSGDQLFASYTYYRADQTAVKSLNLQAHSAQAGGVWKARSWELTPSLSYDLVLLAQTTYLRNRGGGLRALYKPSPRSSFFVEAKDVYQDFARTADVPTAPERNGIQFDATAGAEWQATGSMRLSFNYNRSVKHASRRYNAYNRDSVTVGNALFLGKGLFLIPSATYNYDQYLQNDPSVSTLKRIDKTVKLDVTAGASLGQLHPKLESLLWTVSYEYYDSTRSNLRNYAYINQKISTLLTYRWDVGF
ncbi:MAG: tetratricopeptide repeat protein [Elusimicrobia bacterium]|nr:tetratricopeptide repeat protein [Elusimicrobiota bacterium]